MERVKWIFIACRSKSQSVFSASLPTNCVNGYIDALYNCIFTNIKLSSDICFPVSQLRPYLKPYWSNELKQFHYIMRCKRKARIDEGRPRGRIRSNLMLHTNQSNVNFVIGIDYVPFSI